MKYPEKRMITRVIWPKGQAPLEAFTSTRGPGPAYKTDAKRKVIARGGLDLGEESTEEREIAGWAEGVYFCRRQLMCDSTSTFSHEQ